MTRTLLSFLMSCLVVLSCNKPLADYSSRPFDYSVSCAKEVSIPSNGSIYFGAKATLLSGDPANEPVTVTFKNAPPGLFIGKDNFTFRLNYNLADSFSARNIPPGSYPMQAVFTNAHTTVKTCDFNLVVTAPINWTNKVVGYYYPSNNCGSMIYVSCQIDTVKGAPGRIWIVDRVSPATSVYGTFDSSYGIMDCCSSTFTIPTQKVHGTTVEGTGWSAYNKWIISRKFTNDSITYPCTVTLATSH